MITVRLEVAGADAALALIQQQGHVGGVVVVAKIIRIRASA
jgi:hypothetical protein